MRMLRVFGINSDLQAQRSGATEPAPGGPLEGAVKTKRAVQIADLAATEGYSQRHPRFVDAVELGGNRTAVAVPLVLTGEQSASTRPFMVAPEPF
jgi:hypothetical protein